MPEEYVQARWWRRFYAGWALFALVYGGIEASSVIMEHARAGLPTSLWRPIVNEYTGVYALVLLLPLIRRFDRICRIQRDNWHLTVPAHLLATIPFALLQLLIFVAVRKVLHPWFGSDYTLGNLGFELIYEYRKLGLGYGLALLSMYAFSHYVQLQRLLNMPDAMSSGAESVPAAPASHRFLARHAHRDVIVNATDIRYVEAAGNYVILHTPRGEMKLRETIGNMERQLGDADFVRVHRSYLVNLDAVREIQPWFHGDQRLVLDDGSLVNLSRRYRDSIRLRTGATGTDNGH